MLGTEMIVILSTRLSLGLVVVTSTITALMMACSTFVLPMLALGGAVTLIRFVACFLPGSCEATLQI